MMKLFQRVLTQSTLRYAENAIIRRVTVFGKYMAGFIGGFVSCFVIETVFGWIPTLILSAGLMILYVFIMKHEKQT